MKSVKNTPFLVLFLLVATGLFAQTPIEKPTKNNGIIVVDVNDIRLNASQEAKQATFTDYQQGTSKKEEHAGDDLHAEEMQKGKEIPCGGTGGDVVNWSRERCLGYGMDWVNGKCYLCW